MCTTDWQTKSIVYFCDSESVSRLSHMALSKCFIVESDVFIKCNLLNPRTS